VLAGEQARTVPPYRYEPAGDVPPMQLYGDVAPVRFTGSTHDERAYITKQPATIEALNRHLVAKIEDHRDEIEMVVADLEPGATTLFVSYGVTAGSMREAVAQARSQGRKVSALILHSLWPVPETAITEAAAGIGRIVVAEMNPGLYRREIERVVPGIEIAGIERIDGRLIAPSEFLAELP
jgi:2-oxoglutarate ferredoxin oxidoreductase subunit alpha